jgi:hypothetical protein
VKKILIAVFIIAFCFGSAFAQNYTPGSGVNTSGTGAVNPAKTFQLFVHYNKSDIAAGEETKSPTYGFSYSFTDNLNFSFSIPYLNGLNSSPRAKGWQDIRLGLSYELPKFHENVITGVSVSSKMFTASDPVLSGNGSTDYASVLQASYVFPKADLIFSLNYGWNFWGKEANLPANTTPFYSTMFTYNPMPELTILTEWYGFNPQGLNNYTSQSYFDFIPQWNIDKNWMAQVGFVLGLNNESVPRQFIASLAYTLP